MPLRDKYDVIILGAGAAGLMCAIEAGKRGRRVLLLDHAKKPAEKIRISGGGRCNFTNLHSNPQAFLSQNPHFCKSPLRQYTQHDFIALVERYSIPYHEKTLGQLFCDISAKDIIAMLLKECDLAGVELYLETEVLNIESGYEVKTTRGTACAESLVIATGGPSIPKMGASGFAYDIAQKFGINIIPPRAALVPLTFSGDNLSFYKSLAGVSLPIRACFNKTCFNEAMLFTHRGLSGPAILQISSYWDEENPITVDLLPDCDLYAILKSRKHSHPTAAIHKILGDFLPNRLAESLCAAQNVAGNIAEITDSSLKNLADAVNRRHILPDGTEGYRTAEVTLGGIDTTALSSKTMESIRHKGLFFIGECVDVTGHLGGYNFQWAWSSGFVAGQWV